MPPRPILGVGWDVGGWMGKHQAAAAVKWPCQRRDWSEPKRFSMDELGSGWTVYDLVRSVWPGQGAEQSG
jgi:hypothetical protein